MPSPMERSGSLPEGLASAWRAAFEAFAEGVRPESDLTVSQWADQHRLLSSVSSAEPGPWRTSRTPYLREIMDCFTPSHPMADGVVMAGTQLGKSESLYNAIGYIIHRTPGPIMLVMPTTDTAKKVSKQRIAPMIEATPVLRERVKEARSRDSGNTTLLKEFPGGLIAIVGANSGPALRSMPVRYLLLDEIDAYPIDVDGEGDPEEVAEKRTDTFGARAKRMRVSSPKIKGTSRIERRYYEGSQGRYYVPCPHCRHEQYLRWQQMRWECDERRELVCPECAGITELPRGAEGGAECAHCGADIALTDTTLRVHSTDDVVRVWYECEACGYEIGEHHKTWMLEHGRWIHASPGPGEVLPDDDPHPWAIWAWVGSEAKRYLPRYTKPLSWHLPSLYSPIGWFSWTKAVRQYLRAQQGGYDEATGESLMQVFENTVLAQAYELRGERPETNILQQRAEPYRLGQVPKEALMLVGAVDVQGNRLEALCLGFGRDENIWVIDHQRFYGEPLDLGPNGPWAQLEKWYAGAFPHASGNTLRMVAMGVDSGYLTHTVYTFCAKWRHRHVLATKGQPQMGRPLLGRPSTVDINYRGQVIKGGAQLWPIGVDTGKDRLYRALERAEPGYGYIHFPAGLPDEFYDQLTAEELTRKKVRGLEVREWVLPSGKRNEILDLFVIGMAVAEYAGVRRADWDRLEKIINPAQRDLFDGGGAKQPVSEATAGDARQPAEVAAESSAATNDGAVETARNVSRGTSARPAWNVRRSNWIRRG